MKLGEFLNKYIKKYKDEINLLENENNKNNDELSSHRKKKNEVISKKLRYEKMIERYIVLLGIPTFIGALALYMMNISLLFILFPASVIGLTGYAMYQKNTRIIDDEIIKINNELNAMQQEVIIKGNRNRIMRSETIERLEKLETVRYFFEACNRQNYLNKENNISEKNLLFCLENNISLLGVLYLVNNGLLSIKNIETLSKDDLNKLRIKAIDVDKKIYDNPSIFFNEDNVKMMSHEQMRKRELAGNPSNEPMLAFDGRGFVGYVNEDGSFPVRRNRRGDKYINENGGTKKR